MSRKKGRNKKFVSVPAPDTGKFEGDLTVVPVGFTPDQSPRPIYESTEVPVGQRVIVPKGMTVVPGCYVDDAGVMRFQLNNAPAVWHHPSGCKYHQPPCKRRITNPADIVYDQNNAPWCPDCIGWSAEDEEYKKAEKQAEDNMVDNVKKSIEEAIGISLKPNPKIAALQAQIEAINNAVGDFQEASELGTRQRVMTEEDIKALDAASYDPNTSQLYSGFRGPRPQAFYPSGHPRKW